ncbi:hypothetical protein diail_10799, partial [Diaporthe ilicicola]
MSSGPSSTVCEAIAGTQQQQHQNRALSPHVTAAEWDALLRKTGFSGVDARTPGRFEGVFSKLGFVAQAVDDTVRLLRQPIDFPRRRQQQQQQQDVMDKLVLVGGETPRTARLVRGLEGIFSSRKLARQVHHFASLQACDPGVVDASSTVLSLSELDVPVFEDITVRNSPEAFEGLRRMFGTGKTLLWVTSGRLDTTPLSNMTVGFGRVAQNETPDLVLQQLDVADPDSIQPEVLAETLLRLHFVATGKKDASKGDEHGPMWSVEPEIIIDGDGRQLLSRIRPISEVNDRYMSARRAVTRPRHVFADQPAAAVVLESAAASAGQDATGPSLALREFPGQDPFVDSLGDAGKKTSSEPSIDLRTVLSSSSAIRCGALGYMFVLLGAQADGTRHLVLSSSLAPRLRVPASSAVAVPPRHGSESDGDERLMLAMLSAHLVAMDILRPLKKLNGAVLVAHNPTPLVSSALRIQSETESIRLILKTDLSAEDTCVDGSGGGDDDSWVRLPQLATQSDMDEILLQLQAVPSAFVGFSGRDSLEGEATLVRSLQSQSSSLLILKTDALCSGGGSVNGAVSPAALGTMLNQALANVTTAPSARTDNCHEDLISGTARLQEGGPGSMSLIDWTAAPGTTLPVRISRLDSKPMFKADRTYWVVGMSRALGLALADWMVGAGVKTLVMTSRTTDISADWLAGHARKGVKVVVLPCDVTDEAALGAAHARISSTLPPIAGVIHGAMVLRDTSILKMTLGQLTDVLRPKVQGGLHLDRLFAASDLDFFVLVSSINCVIGNHGQANYAAANTFMCGLAGARRRRGLRAATVNSGAILGAGYMQRELARGELDAIVRRYRMMRMSDGDWCQSICEAIDACRLDSPVGPELTTSIADVTLDEASAPDAPLWCSNPKFSAFVVVKNASDGRGGGGGGEGEGGKVATATVAERLRRCQSGEDARGVIEEAFAAQVRTALGLEATLPDQELMASRATDVGIDSLVSRELGGLRTSVDWDAETRPPADVAARETTETREASSGTDGKRRKPATAGVVVLTGCTGLLGRHLLRHLLAHPGVTQVHCLAPLLGLPASTARSVFDSASAVIHCGADTSHAKHYMDVRASNVGSTAELARECLGRRVPLYYVSSAGLGMLPRNSREDGFPAGPIDVPASRVPDGSEGYMCSKWASERLLERVSEACGLRVEIHRPPTIVREGRDAVGSEADKDWVNAFVKYVRLLRAAPESRSNRGFLDLVRVDTVCEQMMRRVFGGDDHDHDGDGSSGGDVTYFNEVGDAVLALDGLQDIGLEDGKGKAFEVLPREEWTRRALAAGLHPGVAVLIETMDEVGQHYPR